MTIARDSLGYLWLGTDEWVARGCFLPSGRIQAEKIPFAGQRRAPRNQVIPFTPSNQVWLATWAGVFILNEPENPRFIKAAIFQTPLPQGAIDTRSLTVDFQGRMWVFTIRYGFSIPTGPK